MDLLQLINDKIDRNHDDTNRRLDSIDKNLEEHMRRTDILEQLHNDNQLRIQSLEEPSKALKLVVKWSAGIGTIAGTIFAITKLL